MPTAVPDPVKSVVTAGESLLSKSLHAEVSVGTTQGCLNFGGNQSCLDFDILRKVFWLCFGCISLSSVAYLFAYWTPDNFVRSISHWIVSFFSILGWTFSMISLCLTGAILAAAEQLPDSSKLQRGSALKVSGIFFGFATLHLFILTPICMSYGSRSVEIRAAEKSGGFEK